MVETILVKLNGEFRLVEVEVDCDVMDLLRKVLSAFDVLSLSELDVMFRHPMGPEIPHAKLWKILKKHLGCACFFLEVQLRRNNEASPSVNVAFTSTCFRKYLSENEGGTVLLKEFARTNGLRKSSRRALVRILHALVQQTFHGKETVIDVEKICLAAVNLFPCLKVFPSAIGGIDALYDSKNSSGFLYARIKNQRRKRATLTRVTDECGEPRTLTDEEQEIYRILFKTCVLLEDLEKLKNALAVTVDFRHKLRQTAEFMEVFPFYNVCVDLFDLDFGIQFPDIDRNALKNLRPTIESKLIDEFDEELAGFEENTKETFDAFFMLMKQLLPKRAQFRTAAKNFVIYSQDKTIDVESLMQKSCKHPYIIIIDDTDLNSTVRNVKYYVDVEHHLIPIPADWRFLDVMDIFFKIHTILDLEYNPFIKQMMHFVEWFIYNRKGRYAKITAAMHEVHLKIFS